MNELSDDQLLEREAELTAIATLVERGAAGNGACLTLEGPAGVGKTRLLAAARKIARDEGYRVLAARAGEREREYSLGVLRSLFEPVIRSADEAEIDAICSGPAAICRPLLEQGSLPAGGTPDSSFAIFNGFLAAARAIAAEQPLLLAIDDLHWVDGPSLGYLDFLTRRIEDEAVVVIATLRPNEPGSDAALIASMISEPHGSCLRPQPLTAAGSATALRSRLGDGLDDRVVRDAHELTGGNPLLLSEIARTLTVEAADGAESIDSEALHQLGPRSVSRGVEVRLSRAGEAGRALAEAAAVLGEEALLGQAVALAGLDEAAAEQAALDLVRLEVLMPGSRVQFVHPVVRAAVYESLAAPERHRLHARAVEILTAAGAPPERLAGHLLELDPAGDPERVMILRAAAVQAAAGGDSRAATVLMRRALAEPPPAEDEAHVLTQLGASELLVDGPSAAAHLGEAMTRISEPAYKAAIAELLSRALIFQERVEEAFGVCSETIAELEGNADEDLIRRLSAVMIESALIEPARLTAAEVDRADALLAGNGRPQGDDYGSRALAALRAIAGARDLSMTADEAAQRAREAAQGGVLIREGMNSVAQLAPSQALALAGRSAEAIELLNESLKWDERYGSIFGHLSNLVFRARARFFAGELPGTIDDVTESLRLSKAYGIIPGVVWSAAVLAEALIETGENQRAAEILAAEVPPDESAPQGWHWMNFIHTRARLWLETGDATKALAEARTAGEIYADNRGVGPTWLSWRPTAVDAALTLGRDREALALAKDELTLALQWGAPRQIGRALRALAACDEQNRERLLAEAVDVLEGSEARLELARALVDLGAALRRANRKADSREPLRRGMDLAHTCGAEPLAERARTELRASGVRARRTALSGPASLTESERRVVELAAAGRTNREIAAELFVTIKTVEVHLSSAYRKLEIKGRRELAEALSTA